MDVADSVWTFDPHCISGASERLSNYVKWHIKIPSLALAKAGQLADFSFRWIKNNTYILASGVFSVGILITLLLAGVMSNTPQSVIRPLA